ncbi:ABC transporter permease [Brumicola blandensis]|uniref:ABC transporter permease n=1 Tax=Brumicola blandensis TaxID=3075611 RepID=A0AAW8R742_9ALTE|nr:ABC transporter permease [Alteromonas sp. W409]MDT0583795.1 ABC transporter permease [Alteromonas sp. W409]
MFTHYIDLAWRSLKRTPMVSILMVCAIAIGIGITMTSLSVYHMMSMDPIPSKSDQLFAVQLNTTDEGTDWWTEDNIALQLTYKDAMFLHNQESAFRKTASMKGMATVHMNNDELKPYLAATRVVGHQFFNMFELEFIYGGPWTIEQEQLAAPVIVIDEETSEKHFGRPNSVGEQIYLDDRSYQIVGVTKNWDIHTKYYDLNNGAFSGVESIFLPITLIEAQQLDNSGNTNGWKFEEIDSFESYLQSELVWLQFWVELPDQRTKKDYESFLFAYLEEQGKLDRFERKTPEYKLRDVNEWMEYNNVVSEDNKVLVGLSFLFLAVCLANILGLLLGKFLKRAPEVGVRRALGANKRQIFLQHIIEVSMLGLLGGALGIVVAQIGLWGVRTTNQEYNALASMDLSMLLAAPGIAILACILAGLYPAWLVCRTQPAIYLKTQ